MKGMIQFATAAALAAGVVGVSVGCQNAGRRDDTGRAMNASAIYDRAYVATRDSEWVASPGGTAQTLPRGTRAYFAATPTASNEWQQARVDRQGVVWVRPADFAREGR